MKNHSFLFGFAALTILLASCTAARDAANGRTFEDDEVYLSPKRVFITDMAATAGVSEAPQVAEDDYYNPNSSATSKLDMWNRTGYGYGNSYTNGFGSTYGGLNSGWNNNFNWGWSPYVGWGYGAGYGPYNQWNSGLGCYNSWNPYSYYGYSPYGGGYGGLYYNPYWGMNQPYYGWNNYGWNNSYYNWWANGGSSETSSGNVTSGHRRPMASNSLLNTSSSTSINRKDTPRVLSNEQDAKNPASENNAYKPSRQVNGGNVVVTVPVNSASPSSGRATNNVSAEPKGEKPHWSMPPNVGSTPASTPDRSGSRVRVGSNQSGNDWEGPSVPATRSGGSVGGGSRSGGGNTGGGSGTHRR
jgi:hypothetical protein